MQTEMIPPDAATKIFEGKEALAKADMLLGPNINY